MKTESLNLFIVDENKSLAQELKDYLVKRFGEGIRVLTFPDRQNCLEKIDDNTNIVVLNHAIKNENSIETVKLIKNINPKTEVIMLSDRADIGLAIESFKAGAQSIVVKGPKQEKKIGNLIVRIFTAPIRII
ncbi:MAG TPA: response regulator, partial [Bacteroidia bacterium]|nr:response regulator [Bacteroidia bacterium]